MRSRNVLCCVVPFLLASTLIAKLAPWPNSYGEKDKLRYFAEHKDEFDMVLLGSSLTYRSLVPAVLEKELAKHGIEVKAFNLGNAGMAALETDFLLREILALRPANLRHAVVEVMRWDPTIPEEQEFSDRMVYWHSTAETRNALESVAVFPGLPANRLRLAALHLKHWLRKQTGYGTGWSIVRDLLDLEDPHLGEAELERDQGYRALEDESSREFRRRRRVFRRDLAGFREKVRELQRTEGKKNPVKTFNLDALRRQVSLLRDAGITPVHVALPRVKGRPTRARFLVEMGVLEVLLSYDRPSEHPFLYEERNHFDENHLDRETAARFTRLFAKDLARHLRDGEEN